MAPWGRVLALAVFVGWASIALADNPSGNLKLPNGAIVPGVALIDPATGLPYAASGGGGGGSSAPIADTRAQNTPLSLTTVGTSVTIPINGQGTLGLRFSGLSGSGAILSFSASNDGGTTYTAVGSFNAATGTASPTYSADGQTRIDVAGRTHIKITVSTAGTGSASISYAASVATGLTANTSPLVAQPSTGKDIGAVEQFGSWSVGIGGTLPAFASTPTFNIGTGLPSSYPDTLADNALGAPTDAPAAVNGSGSVIAQLRQSVAQLNAIATSLAGTTTTQGSEARGSGLTLPLNAVGQTPAIPLAGGKGDISVPISGLTGSGATVVGQTAGPDGVWSTNIFFIGVNGQPTIGQPITTDGKYNFIVSGAVQFRLAVITAGTGTMTYAYDATPSVSRLIAAIANSIALKVGGTDVSASNPEPTADQNLAQTILALGAAATKAQAVQRGDGKPVMTSGDNVAEADGANATLGAKADAATTGPGSVIAKLAQLHIDLIAPTPAGTAIIGKVGIDQTTPGVTNKVSLGPDNVAVTDTTVQTAVNALAPKAYSLLSNAAAAGNGAASGAVKGADYIWRAEGAFAGLTAVLQVLGLDGSTWFNVLRSDGTTVQTSAPGSAVVSVGQGSSLRVQLTGTASGTPSVNSNLAGLN